MRLAVVGYGGVGKAFVELLEAKKSYLHSEGLDIKVNYVLNSRGGVYAPGGIECPALIGFTKGGGNLAQYKYGGSKDITFDSIMKKKDIDVLIEMTPTNKETGRPGMSYIKSALENGIHVITSNKGPVMLAYKELNSLAVQKGVQFGMGCTAGGALPTVNCGLIDMAGSNILSIEGILNGTTNYILEQMEREGTTYREALKKAMDIGIAEADPTLDVEGWDTAGKLLILTNVLMNREMKMNDISVEGITGITQAHIDEAKKEGRKYKLVGRTTNRDGRLDMTVRPEKIDKSHPLYNIDGRYKAVRYVSDTLGDLTISGGPSGVTPAAASVLRDLVNIHRGYRYSR